MNASATPIERVPRSLLAIVLAISLCPLTPAGEARAQECGEAADAGADASPALAATGFDAQSDEPAEPIAYWQACGTCRWMIDAGGCLTIAPLPGQERGRLEDRESYELPPWYKYSAAITSVRIEGEVCAATAKSMFERCSNLVSADLSGLDTSQATDMGRMFYGCSSLASLDLSGLDTSQATDMSCMFYGCSKLSSLNLLGFGASRVTNMSGMFCECSKLDAVDLSSFDTSRVWSMNRLFYGCSSLVSLDLSAFDTSSVEFMGEMFSGCSSLSYLDVSSFDTSHATDMGSMFGILGSLKAVRLGEGFSFMGAGSWRQCYLQTPSRENGYTGLWERASDGIAFAPDAIPNNVAATYFAQRKPGFVKTSIAGAVVSDIPDQIYTGADVEPVFTVSLDGAQLVKGADYSVTFRDNVATGTATVVVTGLGDYEGAVEKMFSIVEGPIFFPDVDYSEWYGDAVCFVSEKGLITGYSDSGLFGVGDTLTRGQLATILWRNACPDDAASYDPDTAKDTTGLSGTTDGEYYTAAVNWAVANGVITGFDRADGSKDFAAGDSVTFEQLITILSRIGAAPGEVAAAGADLSGFADGGAADTWAASAIAWAANKGLVTGYVEPDGKYLRPAERVARERVAVVLMRSFEMGIL